ncbi:hypothetical protein AArcSl_2767 [Halalkaliarchaeum desulfuricum]|uniref:SipW-cognate class signal peptide n=2 Tax=Halalkaliarchaeum desulfuricum TaxID=2055893 RepID=A0A343TMR0_9EURY|nr:hypothetical protein AArcSl_2767 [Halalkaliarchaeum desulfuricum]
MSDRKFELSRRKALIGLGTVGVASAGAGFGTSAYFSDQEEFTGNSIQAGEFELTVEQQVISIDQDDIGPDHLEAGEGPDGGVWVKDTIEIEDAKPGDEYEFCWDITIDHNPGYVAVAADYDDWTGAEASGLDPDDLHDVDDEGDMTTLGEATEVQSVSLENGDEVTYEYDYLGDLLADLESGALIDDNDDPIQFDEGVTWTLCVELKIPTDVGNELQGARLEWDLLFYAEQARHNDGADMESTAANALVDFPNNPFLDDAQTDNGGLFANLGGGEVVPLEEGTKMSDFPTGEVDALDTPFMQSVYANTTDESISIEVESIGFGPTAQVLGVDPYNETEFGVDDQWYRIPIGIGTPYPIDAPETAWDEHGNFEGAPMQGGPEGDYELVEVSETEDGFKVVWEYLGE